MSLRVPEAPRRLAGATHIPRCAADSLLSIPMGWGFYDNGTYLTILASGTWAPSERDEPGSAKRVRLGMVYQHKHESYAADRNTSRG